MSNPEQPGSGTTGNRSRTSQSRASTSRVIPVIPHAFEQRHRQPQQQNVASANNVQRAPNTAATHDAPALKGLDKPNQQREGNSTSNQDHPSASDPSHLLPHTHDKQGQEIVADKTAHQQSNAQDLKPMIGTNQPNGSSVAQPANSNAPNAPIRELPPAFVPSNHRASSSTATSMSNHRDPHGRPVSTINGAAAIPTNRESSTSSPTPMHRPPMPFTPGQTNFPVPVPGSPYPASNAYHMSEPYAQAMMYPPYPPFAHPPQGREYYNQTPPHFGPTRHNHGPGSRFGGVRRPEEYTFQQSPRNQPPLQRFNSYSQNNNGYMRGPDVMADQSRPVHPEVAPYRMPAAERGGPTGAQQPNLPHDFPNMGNGDTESLANYLLSEFGSRNYADYMLHVTHAGQVFAPAFIPCHGLLLSRSSKLRSLMAMQHNPANPQCPKNLTIVISDKFIVFGSAIMSALRRLYADRLPDIRAVAQLCESEAPQQQMRFALAFAAAGHYLEMEDVVLHGLYLAKGLLEWQTLDKALAFALEGGLGPSWHQVTDRPTGEEKSSSSSFEDTASKLDSPSPTPVYGYYSDRLLHDSLQYLIDNLPANFKFSPAAPQLLDVPRLPDVSEPRHSRSSSRLSRIRFGEMTVDDESSTDPTAVHISSILMSLPFQPLKYILENGRLAERLGATTVAAIAQTIVDEREQRRSRAYRIKNAAQPTSALDERVWHNVRWTEFTEPAEESAIGFKLCRRRISVETPTSASS